MANEHPIKTAVVCHDAGGAEVVSSYVRQHNIDSLFILEGPAVKVFERKLGSIKISSLKDAVYQSASVLCGTSWQSDIEFNAIKLARELEKSSVAFLDHWVNYQDRFIRYGETVLPDKIWVGDTIAESIAIRAFPNTSVVLIDNPYLLDIKNELHNYQIGRLSLYESISVIYICEPISTHAKLRYGDARYWGYVEEDALRYFLSNISIFGHSISQILIRPHPSEPIGKYNWLKKEFKLPIQLGGSHSLVEEIANSDLVAGCESMGMVVGLLAGKKVVSCIPPGGKSCGLPHIEIVHLQNIL